MAGRARVLDGCLDSYRLVFEIAGSQLNCNARVGKTAPGVWILLIGFPAPSFAKRPTPSHAYIIREEAQAKQPGTVDTPGETNTESDHSTNFPKLPSSEPPTHPNPTPVRTTTQPPHHRRQQSRKSRRNSFIYPDDAKQRCPPPGASSTPRGLSSAASRCPRRGGRARANRVRPGRGAALGAGGGGRARRRGSRHSSPGSSACGIAPSA